MEKTTLSLFEEFIEIEDKYDLFSLEIHHIKIWQYIRFTFCARIIKEITGIETTSVNKGSKRLKEWEQGKKRGDWLKRCPFLLRRKDLIVVSSSRRVKTGNVYKCMVTDALLKEIKYSYYVFEDAYRGGHYSPVCTKGLKYRNINVLQKIFPYKGKIDPAEIKNIVSKILSIFEQEFSVKFDITMKSELHQQTSNIIRSIIYGRMYAKIILSFVKPKAVIVAEGYNVINQALIEIAKQKEIPTIELQHGRIGNSHAAYNFEKIRDIDTFPDYIFVYGDYEKKVPRYPISREQIYATGYPELEKRARYYKSKRKKNKYRVVTFISSAYDAEIMSRYAVALVNGTKEKIKIIYKLHPSEYGNWKKYYPDMEALGIHIINDNLHDIYYYLGQSDYVIGTYSTALYEAMQFNTNIIILKELDYQKSAPIYENGCGELISGTDELLETIMLKERIDNKKNGDFYFENNSLQKMKWALEKCMSNKQDEKG